MSYHVVWYIEDGEKRYVKAGGDWRGTDELQEAQLFGWSKRARETAERKKRYFELSGFETGIHRVKIQIDDE